MKFGGYIRVSKVGGREGDRFLSPTLQRERIQGWCTTHDHDLVDVREDLDVSGARTDRDQLLDLVAAVEGGQLDGIIVATLDRFGRSLPFAVALIDRIDKAGGQFVSVADGLDTRTPYGRLALNIMLSIAQFELERIRAQWRVVVERQIKGGRHPGPQPPFGYQRATDGRLEPSEPAATTVTTVFHLFAGGENLSQISRNLADSGVRTQTGSLPSRRFLQGILTNRVYLGEARSGKVVQPGAHPPLVDDLTFRRCQGGFRPRPARGSTPGELTGLVRCQGCRYVMSRVHREGKPRYRCLGNQAGRTCPAPAFVTEDQLVPIVHRMLFVTIDHQAAEAAGDTDETRRLTVELEAAEAELVGFRDEPGVIAALGTRQFADGLQVRRAEVDRVQQQLAAALSRRPVGLPDATTLRAEWDRMDPGTRNAIVGAVFDAVVVRKHPSRSLRLPIEERVRLLIAGSDVPFTSPGSIVPFDWPDDPGHPWVLPAKPLSEDR